MQELLLKHFVSTWSITAQLKEITALDFEDSASKMAAACLGHYRFPVQIICLLPDATVVNSINANDILDVHTVDEDDFVGFSDPIDMRYHQFLDSCIELAHNDHNFNELAVPRSEL